MSTSSTTPPPTPTQPSSHHQQQDKIDHSATTNKKHDHKIIPQDPTTASTRSSIHITDEEKEDKKGIIYNQHPDIVNSKAFPHRHDYSTSDSSPDRKSSSSILSIGRSNASNYDNSTHSNNDNSNHDDDYDCNHDHISNSNNEEEEDKDDDDDNDNYNTNNDTYSTNDDDNTNTNISILEYSPTGTITTNYTTTNESNPNNNIQQQSTQTTAPSSTTTSSNKQSSSSSTTTILKKRQIRHYQITTTTDDENSKYCFVSEPSVSEDNATSATLSPQQPRLGSYNTIVNTTMNHSTNQQYYLMNNSVIVRGDIIQVMKKSASNTSLSSLGSPGGNNIASKRGSKSGTGAGDGSNSHFITAGSNSSSSSKKQQIFFPVLGSSSSGGGGGGGDNNDMIKKSSLLLGPLEGSGSLSETSPQKLNFDDSSDNCGDKDDDNNNKNNSSSNNNNIKKSSCIIQPRPSPMMPRWNDEGNDNEIDTKNNYHEPTFHTVTSSKVENDSKLQRIYEVGESYTEEDNNDDGLSFESTVATKSKIEDNSEEEMELTSPPEIYKKPLYDGARPNPSSPFDLEATSKTNTNANDDENDSITPKRKTRSDFFSGEENVATEADDESKPRAQRKRIYSDGKGAPKHRRKRSGDEAAAKMLPGGSEWVGMEHDHLPLPIQNEEDEEDEEDDVVHGEDTMVPIFSASRTEDRSNRRKSRIGISESSLMSTKQVKIDDDIIIISADPMVNVMPAEEFSRYARSVDEVEYGNSPSPHHYTDENVVTQSAIHVIKDEKVNLPMGDASVSSAGSQGTNQSAFSWISNRVSLLSNKDVGPFDTSERDAPFDNSSHMDVSTPNTTNIYHSLTTQERRGENETSFNAYSMNLNHMPEDLLQPQFGIDDRHKVFTCPRCHRKQRKYFTADMAPKSFTNPITLMVAYFVVYVIAALFIFGMEEGWPPLDCIYFAVMTLTTTGLGDYAPTTNSAKIVCSIFMYFGVACKGLLLGVLHANSLDHASRKAFEESLVSTCIYCNQQNENVTKSNNDRKSNPTRFFPSGSPRWSHRSLSEQSGSAADLPIFDSKRSLSPITSKTRPSLHTIDEMHNLKTGLYGYESNIGLGRRDDEQSEESSHASTISLGDKFKPVTQIKAAKYIFLTLKQAFANTLFILGFGCVGFMYIEGMKTVNAFYFATSLLTTVGYGDIVPKTDSGKVFATIFEIVAWMCLLFNISMISMIPLELRKRRIDHSILIQFDDLDDAALQELVSGPLVKRLYGTQGNNLDDVNECTKEMFALTMLIRLGRVSEEDVHATFATFEKLDKNNEGVLTATSKRHSQATSRDFGSYLPRLRDSSKSMLANETSALLHPLAESNELGRRVSKDYMSAPRPEMEPLNIPKLQLKDRGISLESIWSTITDENNWD